MDIKTLDRLALEDKIMEPYWRAYEQCYFLGARSLYKDHKKGNITIDRARKEKQILVATYMRNKKEFEFVTKLWDIEIKLKQLKKEGFNSVIEWEILERIDDET